MVSTRKLELKLKSEIWNGNQLLGNGSMVEMEWLSMFGYVVMYDLIIMGIKVLKNTKIKKLR